MKLAEALLLRADLQKKLAALRGRISANAVVQQGDKPHEDPEKLIKEALGVLRDLESLIFRINQANLKHKLPDGRSLTQAIAARDMLIQRNAVFQAAIDGTRREPDRYSAREIKWVAKVDVARLQKQGDETAKTIRELNAAIQEANWKATLPDAE